MRAVFFGTPEIAVPALRALMQIANVVAVVSQPDRPAGRGMRLALPAVKVAAQDLGLAVHQPRKVKTGELAKWLGELDVDVALVMAYGRILPEAVLKASRHGCLNLHASLLPAYRGAAPIQRALMAGEPRTGISLMQMDAGMDTGPVYCTREIDVEADETAGELSERLARLAAEVTQNDLPGALDGTLTATAQEHENASYAAPLEKSDSSIDFRRPARDIHNQIRGLSPRPAARTTLGGKQLKILRSRLVDPEARELPPGRVEVRSKKRVVVGTGQGVLELAIAQLEGKRALEAEALVNGRVLVDGVDLGLP
jgi:methionyl-tRNA formyltransferase